MHESQIVASLSKEQFEDEENVKINLDIKRMDITANKCYIIN